MLLRKQDGIHAEYGCAKNVYPRTLTEAYGRYTTLHVPREERSRVDVLVVFMVLMGHLFRL